MDTSCCIHHTGYGSASVTVLRVKGQGSLTVFLGQLEGLYCAIKVGARYHELGAADFLGPPDNACEIIRVSLSAMILTPEYGIRQIDTDLLEG